MHKTSSVLEPIAIIGIGCRLPGDISGPDSFWHALTDELDVVGTVPDSRFSMDSYFHPDRNHAGTAYTRAAAMLSDVDRFDAGFFRIAPQEASRIDPQHRILLEVAWEALEDAGQPPSAIAGHNVGVFIGQAFQDYFFLQQQDLPGMNAYTMMGSAACMAANRLSYFFDLNGPSETLDTACASALTSVHAACQSIWTGESDMALAGGVSVLLLPGGFIGFSRAQMLSKTGRCQSFSAQADGYVRAEGAGVVVLKPLAAARAAGDRIYALLRATGINHHGHSHGITFPGVAAQEALLRRTIARAGIEPHSIQYAEAHGTGTQAGDPVEATALGRALGAGRPASAPLRIGSVKSNVGHSEAAAGVIGLIKLTLAIHHAQLPASLHAQTLNPDIPFAQLGLKVVNQAEAWPSASGPRRGVVSAFGFGGANACAVLEQAPSEPAAAPAETVGPYLLPLSARSPEALRALAFSWAGMLRSGVDASPQDLAYTAALRRDHHDHRVAFCFHDTQMLQRLLGGWLRDEPSLDVQAGRARGRRPKVAFAFCGNGPQWWGMARGLLATEPAFRAALVRCQQAFLAAGGDDLIAELERDEATTRMHRTDVAQPTLFAIQLGLCELLATWGVRPDAVIGHSVGEVAAAYVCGALDFAEAVRVLLHRSRTQQLTEGSGRLAAAGISLAEGQRLVEPFGDRLCVSAHNSPRQITFSGELEALRALGKQVEAAGAFWREIPVDYAFHSRAMDPVKDEFLRAVTELHPRAPSLPFYSTVSGRKEPEAQLDADYFWRNLRQPVMFASAAQALIRAGHEVVIEIGPHPVLRTYFTELAATEGAALTVISTLRRKEDDREQLSRALAALYVAGCSLDLASVARPGRLVSVPTYAWQRERHFHQPASEARALAGRIVHPLLGRRSPATRPEWSVELDPQVQTWLREHIVGGAMVFPAAGYVEQCLAVAKEEGAASGLAIERLEIDQALVVAEAGVAATVLFEPATGRFELRSGQAGATLHAHGELRHEPVAGPVRALDVAAIAERCAEQWPKSKVYGLFERRGLRYGAAFRGIESVLRRDGESLSTIALPTEVVAAGEDGTSYRFHPVLLDACLQTFMTLLPPGCMTYVPIAFERIELHAAVPTRFLCHVELTAERSNILLADVTVTDPAGGVIAHLKQVAFRAIDLVSPRLDALLYGIEWQPQPLDGAPASSERGHRPGAADLAERAGGTSLGTELLTEYRERTLPDENALCTDYVTAALARLGFAPAIGDEVTAAALAAAIGIVEKHVPQLERLLEFLAEDGILAPHPTRGWTVARPIRSLDLAARFRSVWSAHPAGHAQLELTHRIGLRLPELLRGETDALALLFSEGSAPTLEEIYDASPGQWFSNAAIRGMLEQLVDTLPSGARLEVLEVGAGTGGLTGWLLPALPAERVRYRFTDVTEGFAPAARARFSEYAFVEYDRLDLEAPEERHLAQPADVIVASNVLHATRDIRETLSNLRRLVRPGGCLIFVEVAPGVRAVELVYGFLPGWWRGKQDALRPKGPLLPAQRWRELAIECGFEDAVLATDTAQTRTVSVVVAQAARAPRSASGFKEEVPREAWLLLADEGGVAGAVAQELEREGARPYLARAAGAFSRETDGSFHVRPEVAADLEQVLARITADGLPLRGILHGWALDATDGEQARARVETAGCLGLASLLRAQTSQAPALPPRLWIATRGARQVAGGERPAVLQAMMWGLGRSVMQEHAALRPTLVDLDPAAPPALVAAALCRDLLARESEPLEQAIAYRDGGRLVERLAQLGDKGSVKSGRELESFHLARVRPGTISGVGLVETPRRAPGHGEVEIAVHAAGLNFRDVLFALDVLPSRESPPQLGLDCAGVITAVGEGVPELAVGDEVMALASGSIGRFVVARAAAVTAKPKQLHFAAAATLPATFATALYALYHLGRLQPGERLLVHGGAGALGLAALQLARARGAEVFATAGTPEKRELLRALGATLVMDSRSLAFVEQIREATGGEGVDVVLNSLAGEALAGSLSVLKPLGRFLEVGKRDFFENSRLGWRLLQQRSFHGIDLEKVMAADERLLRALLSELRQRCEAGEIAPLPHRVFPLARAAEAFSTMQRSRHVGKLVIETRDTRLPVRCAPHEVTIRRDGSYLITGGLGGLGLAMAAWLAEQGAGRVVLLARSAPSPEQESRVAAIAATGTEVLVQKVDVADGAALARVLDGLRASGAPLRGVLHAAMVLDDSLLINVTPERLAKVMGPKVQAALHLDAQTRADPLDLFLCCSSVVGLVGNPGQAVYAGANTVLDALCLRRRAEGLPALSVSLGAIADVGFVARTSGLVDSLASRGMIAFPVSDGIEAMARALRSSHAHVGILRYDWSRYAGAASLVTRLAEERKPGTAERDTRVDDLRARIASASEKERRQLLRERLSWHVSRILGIAGDDIDSERSIVELGMDSLMMVDLQHFIQSELGADVPVMSILQGWSIARLVEEVERRLGGGAER